MAMTIKFPGFLTGWGVTSFGGNQAGVLQEVTVKYVDNEECNDQKKYRGIITPAMLCAAAPSKDACQVKKNRVWKT